MDEIDRTFAELDAFYPGSKRRRRTPDPAVEERRRRTELDEESWDARPFTKTIRGVQMEMFTIGALAKALSRPVVTLRLWIRQGHLPTSMYRMPARVVDGVEQKGRRLYTRGQIEACIEVFRSHGILDERRVNWDQHMLVAQEIKDIWAKQQAD